MTDDSSRKRLLALGVAAVWPTLHGLAWGAVDPIAYLEAHLDALRAFPFNESPVIASQMMFLPDAALCFLPGLLALRGAGFPRVPSPATRRQVWRGTLWGGAATLLVALVGHVTVDLPTGDLGPEDAVAAVRMGTRLADVAISSVLPALFEECYFRGRLFGAMAHTFTPRATIGWTALAFGACHPPELIPFALVWGVAAGLVRERLGTFWPIVAAHAAWNAVAYADAWLLLG